MPRPTKPPRLFKYKNRQFWYIRDGREAHSTGTADKEEAQCFLAEYVALKSRPKQPTINQLLDLRAQDLLARKTARGKDPEAFHQNLREHFGRLRPELVTLPVINQFKQKREHVPAMLREELIEYNATINLAVKMGLIEKGIKADLPPQAAPRQHYISRTQADTLLENAHSFHLQLFILIAIQTGHRKGAILDLTWDRVDFERQRLDFNNPDRAQTNKRRTVVPVKGAIWQWLQIARSIRRTNHVIEYNGKPVSDIKKSFERTVKKAQLPDWLTPHVLKHSVISWLCEDKVPIEEIAELTATDVKTVKRIYRHVSPDYLENAAQNLSQNSGIASRLVKQHQLTPTSTHNKRSVSL